MSIPLNFHHLYYFWVTAKAGRVSQAARSLLLSQPALSMQISQLERSLGKKLLERGRAGVTLTLDGRIAFEYSERIFSQGAELAASFQKGAAEERPRLRLGVSGAVPRHVVAQLLDRIRSSGNPVRVAIFGGVAEGLRGRLERHQLDMVVSNFDFSQELGVEFRARLSGSVPFRFVAAPALKRRLRRYPRDLARVPMLLPAAESPARKSLDLFLWRARVKAAVEAEIEDAELLRVLALRGEGVAALDALTAAEDLRRGRLVALGRGSAPARQQVWLICGRHPKPNPFLRAAIEDLMTGFRIRI